MPKFSAEDVLPKLVKAFPRPLGIYDFQIPDADRQEFMNYLLELHQDGLIHASFQISRMRENYGIPFNVANITITKEGRSFLKTPDASEQITQHIVINGNASGFNIAGRDMHIENGQDCTELLRIIINKLENSKIDSDKKSGLIGYFQSILSSSSSSIISSVIIESVKLFLNMK